uniref:7TM_GPCR_Srx domain-containing protein n=1 Tax=Steinernema glaseri TaxID=37863 RepID=A0A1I7YKR2_9BILA
MSNIYAALVGPLYLLVSILGIVVIATISSVILRTPELRRLSSYRISLQLNMFLLILAGVNVFTGIKITLDIMYSDMLENILGATLNFAWIGTMTSSFTLALDRFVTIVFSKQATRLRWILIGSMVCSYVPALVLFTIDVSPYTAYIYEVREHNWVYLDGEWTELADIFEQSVTFPALVASLVLYILIFLYITKVHPLLRLIYLERIQNRRQANPETRILTVSIISFAYIVLEEAIYQFASSLLERSEEARVLVDFVFTSYPLVCQITHLLFNRNIAKKVYNTVVLWKKSNAQSVERLFSRT